MINKLKTILGGAGGILIFIIILAIPIFLINYWEAHFETIYPFLVIISEITFWVALLCLLISLFPKARSFTGTTIVYCSWIWGALLWGLNLYTSGVTLGNIWTIFGILFAGVGVFITAGIGMIINGQFSSLFMMIIDLVLIYGIRMLGIFIASKYPEPKINDEAFVTE